jgi:SP family general alpha glucoside:H+ symporter-like MFS transporter
MEKSICKGTSYLDLFRGTNLRRTEVSCGTWICQVTCGAWFGGNIIYFMQQAGLDASVSFSFGLGVNAVSCACTIASWFITPYVGRRTLYLQGLFWMLITELMVGFVYIEPPHNAGYIAGAFLILNSVAFYLTIGPIAYIIVPEAPSVRLRIKTVALARICYSAFAIMAGFLTPYILNPSAWDLKGKGGLVWGVFCLVSHCSACDHSLISFFSTPWFIDPRSRIAYSTHPIPRSNTAVMHGGLGQIVLYCKVT